MDEEQLDTTAILLDQGYPFSRKVELPVFSVKSFVDGKLFLLNDASNGQCFVSVADTSIDTLEVRPANIPLSYRRLLRRHDISAAANDSVLLADNSLKDFWAPRLFSVQERNGHLYEYIRIRALGRTSDLPGHAGDSTWLMNQFDFLEVDGNHLYYIDQSDLFRDNMSFSLEYSEPIGDKLLVTIQRTSPASHPLGKPMFATFALQEDSVFKPEKFEACQLPAFYDSVGQGYVNASGPIHIGLMMPRVLPLLYETRGTGFRDYCAQLTSHSCMNLLFGQGTNYFMSDFRLVGSSIRVVYNTRGSYYVGEVDRETGLVHFKRRLDGQPLLDSILFISDTELLGLSADGMRLLRWRL